MKKNFKVIRPKRKKNILQKTMLRIVLPAYAGGIILMFGIIAALLPLDLPEVFYEAALFVLLGVLIAASLLIIFVIVPRCRVRQSLRDYENYYFTPYVPKDEETFTFSARTEKYYFTPSPFDDDEGEVPLSSGNAADDYFSQFAPERLKIYEILGDADEIIPFNVYVFGSDNFLGGKVEKRREGEYITVTVTDEYSLTFAPDGVHLADKIFPYAETEASVYAAFLQSEACAAARLNLLISDECAASFAFGTRIAAIVDKYKIPVKNREIFDYILSDPREAFRRIGLKRVLKIKKKSYRAALQ